MFNSKNGGGLCLSQFGIKIKNISAGMLYDVNLGIRDYFVYTDAIFHNSLFQTFLLANGLKVHKGESTRDLVCLDFDFGSRSFDEEKKRLDKLLAQAIDADSRQRIQYAIDKVISNQDKYQPKKREEIRQEFYEHGVPITYISKNKDGTIKSTETIHYEMLYRTSAKAKSGQVIFINKKLYAKAYNWLTMGIGERLPMDQAKIVELSAYAPLTTSTIIDQIHIPVDNILILKDQSSEFFTKAEIVRAEPYEKILRGKSVESRKCVVEHADTSVENVLWDGLGLIDDSVFPAYANGMMLLRNHFFKMCGFRTKIQAFFRDWCKSHNVDYNTFQIQDMFGRWHYVADIQVITTHNAIKWLKFQSYMGDSLPAAYEYWCKKIRDDGCMWGVVKTDHRSKLGTKQQMSYQMINTLPCTKEDIDDIMSDTVGYVEVLKSDPDEFERFLRKNATAVNHYEMLADMYQHNKNFANSTWFRHEKKKIISAYVMRLRNGKVMVNGDNLTVCGNPYALLLYSVGDSWKDDPTLNHADGVIECYTPRFRDGEYLAAFRNPHNSPNGICYLRNRYSPELTKYFPFSANIMAVNCIESDIQARANGMDFDLTYWVGLEETLFKKQSVKIGKLNA